MPKLAQSIRRTRLSLINRRRARRELSPYVVLSLDGEIVEFPQQQELPIPGILRRFVPLPQGPLSLSALRRTFEQIALDGRVQGVVLKISCGANPAIYQSLRSIVLRFRESSHKRVVAYAETFGPFQFYLACACDQIAMPPSAEWAVTGFSNEYVFLKDALDRAGVGVDVVNVSPFKSAGDQFARNDFSDESRAQAEWLLDARYAELVRGIADGRKLTAERVRDLIDCAPMSTGDAVKHGLLDAALYEDELERYLMPDPPKDAPSKENKALKFIERFAPKLAEQVNQAQSSQPKSRVWVAFDDARKSLLMPDIQYGDKVVGVVSIEGLIVPGSSRKSPLPIPIPLFGGEIAGSASVAQAIRKAEADPNVAAVVLYVDSSGGSALASDLMAREVKRLQAKKPVVAYMGGVAASGGYYVSALAQHIVAQPLTVTGSIGVILIKPHLDAAYGKVGAHRTTLQRGANASLFDDTPLDERERTVVAGMISRTYAEFKQAVAEGRKLPVESLEPLCGGRVWTGAQAYERKLIDTLGDFPAALEKARELANLPTDKRTAAILITPPRKPALPPMFALANPATLVFDQLAALKQLFASTRTWALTMFGGEVQR